jgi:hypothetical protein
MCGGFVGDILDSVGDVIEDVGDFIGDTVEAVVDNPIGAIVSVGAMAMGVPPVWAGALGGGANAAANGGNVLEGALLGGVTGYVGGVAGGAAAQAGANNILAGAAGGAAAGATGAALTGGDIVRGALGGGVLGAGSGAIYSAYTDASGNQVYQYDDGSTITRNAAGEAVSSTPAPGQQAPVYEYNPSTQRIEQYNPNGQINVLDEAQTAALMRNVDPNMINSLVDQNNGQPFRVEVSGAAGTAEAPSYAKTDLMTPGSELATQAQIDAGQATWNPNANAWEIGAPTSTYKGPETYTFDDGSTMTMNADGSSTFTDATMGQTTGHAAGTGSAQQNAAGGVTYTYDDGTWLTINPDGTSAWTDTTGTMHSSAGGTYTGHGNNGGTTDLGELEITAPRDPSVIDDPNDIVHHDVLPETDTTTMPGGEGGWTTPVTPVFPTIPVGGTTPTEGDEGGVGGDNPVNNLKTYYGLNPGWIQAVPQYATTNDVQDPFFWGAHPFQAGPTFNSALASHGIGAPAKSWGLQQQFTPMTQQDYVNAINQPRYQQATYQQPVQVAQAMPAGPAPMPMPVQYAPIISAPVVPAAPDGIIEEDLLPYAGIPGPVAPVPA